VIWLASDTAGEPSELSMRVRIDDQGWATLQETSRGGRLVTGVRADRAALALSETLARRLAPLRLDRPRAGPARAGPVRLRDLLGPSAGAAGPGSCGCRWARARVGSRWSST
jgi:hypothetical protein